MNYKALNLGLSVQQSCILQEEQGVAPGPQILGVVCCVTNWSGRRDIFQTVKGRNLGVKGGGVWTQTGHTQHDNNSKPIFCLCHHPTLRSFTREMIDSILLPSWYQHAPAECNSGH